VRFEKDEPIAVIFPVRRNGLAAFEPEIQSLDSDPALKEQWLAFTEKQGAVRPDRGPQLQNVAG